MPVSKNAFIHSSAEVIDVDMSNNAKIYKNAFVKNCILKENSIIGDFTRTENSIFAENTRVQRNNLIYSAKLGKHSYTGKNCTVWHSNIGKFCSLSWNLSIGAANHDYNRTTTHSFIYAPEFGFIDETEKAYERFDEPCEIGNDVWIAANACIMRDVKIGDGAVIGAGAIVTKDVEPYTIVVGAPAKPIKLRFDKNLIERLLNVKWWDFPDEIIKKNIFLFSNIINEDVIEKLEALKKQL